MSSSRSPHPPSPTTAALQAAGGGGAAVAANTGDQPATQSNPLSPVLTQQPVPPTAEQILSLLASANPQADEVSRGRELLNAVVASSQHPLPSGAAAPVSTGVGGVQHNNNDVEEHKQQGLSSILRSPPSTRPSREDEAAVASVLAKQLLQDRSVGFTSPFSSSDSDVMRRRSSQLTVGLTQHDAAQILAQEVHDQVEHRIQSAAILTDQERERAMLAQQIADQELSLRKVITESSTSSSHPRQALVPAVQSKYAPSPGSLFPLLGMVDPNHKPTALTSAGVALLRTKDQQLSKSVIEELKVVQQMKNDTPHEWRVFIARLEAWCRSAGLYDVLQNGISTLKLPSDSMSLSSTGRSGKADAFSYAVVNKEFYLALSNGDQSISAELIQMDINKYQAIWRIIEKGINQMPTAQLILNSIPIGNGTAAYQQIDEKYYPRDTTAQNIIFAQFNSLQQVENEPLNSWLNRLTDMCHRMEQLGSPQSPMMIRHKFVLGLFDADTRRHVTHDIRDTVRITLGGAFACADMYERMRDSEKLESQQRKALKPIADQQLKTELGSGASGYSLQTGGSKQKQKGSDSNPNKKKNQSASTDDVICYNCKGHGHYKNECPSKKQDEQQVQGKKKKKKPLTEEQKKLHCDYCDKTGHVASKCFRRIKDEQEKSSSSSDSSDKSKVKPGDGIKSGKSSSTSSPRVSFNDVASVNMFSAQATLSSTNELRKPVYITELKVIEYEFILDCGATVSSAVPGVPLTDVTRSSFTHLKTAGEEILHNPSEGKLTATIAGSEDSQLVLSCVLTHAGVTENLLSIRQILSTGDGLKFGGNLNSIFITDKFGNELIRGDEVDGLYRVYLQFPATEEMIQMMEKSNVKSLPRVESQSVFLVTQGGTVIPSNQMLWHQRLGHIGATKLNEMISNHVVTGIDDIKSFKRELSQCIACREGKAQFEPFRTEPRHDYRMAHPLDRVHADLFGPVQTESLNGDHYALILVDDFSSRVWFYALKRKSEATEFIQVWVNQMMTSKGKPPSEFHSDPGGEFVSTELDQFFKKRGIKHPFTLVATPQHNARCERENKTIAERIRTMLIQSGAPQLLWNEAAEYSVHIMNRALVRTGETRTPQQLFEQNDEPLTVEHFKVWGCDAVIHVKDATKFNPVGVSRIFIGLSHAEYGWRFLDPHSLQIEESRNAKFNESSFQLMQVLRETIHDTDMVEDVEEEEFWTNQTLRNEVELMKQITQPEVKVESASVKSESKKEETVLKSAL